MLKIDLKGKKAFIAGIGDDQGFGWSIAKSLAEAGAEILVGTWAPVMKIFQTSLESGKYDQSRLLSDGNMMQFAKIYPLDASFDKMEEVPEETRENKRYKSCDAYTIQDVALQIGQDFGKIDYFVHSLANAPEVQKPLLETSRQGYLASLSASTYSFISLLAHLGPIMNAGGSTISLTYIASEKAIPGYGGGMSSAKAALESDTRTLAWEAGRKWNIRVNAISAGPLRSRAARAIGFIDKMIDYAQANAPLQKDLTPIEVGNVAAFLLSPLASAITGETIHVDNGMHAMGMAIDSAAFNQKTESAV
ncbi:enoyl-[acyl-carrier-protein] reductase [Parachlamydia sp. AcF125]|uniref:enoyl-[acyl-carrier-protein] reductase n=1 Tax=Parachlamydia sp. AcF125 TaxID=2795736 RepID=UPI001BC92880|nr:enoyl-[acyl-carrier-protein] reductase [Parachlamydia sp. AcF125]MBS4168927.1 Enoyl-[acyl-carrier-protein] reductase [NADPH] FabI [Parachlamydia sp. AcF125]